MKKLPLPTQTLYAELLEQLVAREADRSIGHLAGSFVTKKIKGTSYYYFQYPQPGGTLKQIYLGKADALLRRVLKQMEKKRREVREEEGQIHQLCAQLRAGDAMLTDPGSARVLKALADGGVFKAGGTLIGTHAFTVLGNMLGYAWEGAGLRTQDLDIAAESILSVVVPEISADVPKILDSLQLGFLPVPPLNHKNPSTSFMVRGKALRVDLLTPVTKVHKSKPVSIAAWKTFAQPLPFLDFLLEDTGRGIIINGGGILVNVPAPARFALHKLIIFQERPYTFHAKIQKDQIQAAQILQVLLDERPGDLELAWKALKKRGPSWVKKTRKGLLGIKAALGKSYPPIQKILK